MTTYTQDQVDELITNTREETIRELARKCRACPLMITPETQRAMLEHTGKVVDLVSKLVAP